MASTAETAGRGLFQKSDVQFLEGWDEAFMIGLPWLGAAVTLLLWILGRFNIAWQLNDVSLMLAGLIFIDGVHIIFTYVMMASLPELKQWSASEQTRAKSGWAKGRGPWARSALIALALGAIVYLLKVSPNTSTLRGMATTFLLLELVGPAQHTIAQMRGISFIYNSTIRKNYPFTDAEKEQAARCENLERFFFKALLTGEIFYWIPDIFGLDHLNIPGISDVHFVGGVVAVAACAGLLVNGYYFPKQDKSKKMAFLFRVVLFPLKMLTMVGGISLRAAHGTEYLTIFRKMVKNSNTPKARKNKVFLITFLVSALYAGIFCLTWPYAIKALTGATVPTLLISWAILGTFVLRFTHYYMDAVLFKMSDPATRAAVGPLLAPKIPEAAPARTAPAKKKGLGGRLPIAVGASLR